MNTNTMERLDIFPGDCILVKVKENKQTVQILCHSVNFVKRAKSGSTVAAARIWLSISAILFTQKSYPALVLSMVEHGSGGRSGCR
jgi:hypothetical protein